MATRKFSELRAAITADPIRAERLRHITEKVDGSGMKINAYTVMTLGYYLTVTTLVILGILRGSVVLELAAIAVVFARPDY